MKIKTFIKLFNPRFLLSLKYGKCLVCSQKTIFVLNGSAETVRNHAVCIRCKSNSRNRHVVKIILESFKKQGITKLADFQLHPKTLILNTSSTSPIAKNLGSGSNIICSEYYDDVPLGKFKAGVLNQDLQNLTFEDNTFDLIISEDVFEHIPDYQKGFKEIHRVLKQNGCHIFTIPFYFDQTSQKLFEIKDGKVVLNEPIEYHGDPIRGVIPCFHYLGYDLISFLNQIGFVVRIEISKYVDQIEFSIFDCYTFITTKK